MDTIAKRAPIAPTIVGGMAAVIAFDALGSWASKQFGFSYALLIPGSLVIYGVVAGLVARRGGWHLGLFAAIAMAFTDLTVGWAVSWLIGPGKPTGGLTATTVLGAVMTALVAAGLAGSIGAWLGVRRASHGSGTSPAA